MAQRVPFKWQGVVPAELGELLLLAERLNGKDGQVIDPMPMSSFPCCLVCATWVCTACWDFRRPYANMSWQGTRLCGRCGGDSRGFWLATRHYYRVDVRSGHKPRRRTPFRVLPWRDHDRAA